MRTRTLIATGVIGLLGWAAPRPAASGPDAVGAEVQQEIATTLTGADGRQPRLALPDFHLSGTGAELQQAAGTVAEVLWRDLEFEDEFYMIPRDVSARVPLGPPGEPLAFARWAEVGADYVAVGQAGRTETTLDVEMRVIGVRGANEGRVFLGMRYGCPARNPRYCAHYIADDLHRRLRSLVGVARTRLAFVSDRDGERLGGAYDRSSREVYIADYDGANQQRVTANRALKISPAWSPDARSLAYTSYASGFPDIYLAPVYEVQVRLRRPAGGTEEIHNQFPAWSPDGSRLAFASNREGGGNLEIYVVDADGRTPPRRLTFSPALDYVPEWSPNGAQIVFASDRTGQGNPLLYVMGADGAGLSRLPCGNRCDRPSWAPGAQNLIAYTCGSGPGFDICALDLQTMQVRVITDGLATNEQPAFAPNGRHIAFVTTRWGRRQVAIVDLKGRIKRRVTELGNNDFPNWSRVSASGQ